MDTLFAWMRLHRWHVLTVFVLSAGGLLLVSDVIPRYVSAYELARDWQRQRAKLAEVAAWQTQKADIEAERDHLEARFNGLYVSLPRSDQMSAILQRWQQSADETGVVLRQVRPAERVSHPGYHELPFRIELNGPFHGIGRFVDALERSRYVMKVSSLALEREKETVDLLLAELSLSVIVFKEMEPRQP